MLDSPVLAPSFSFLSCSLLPIVEEPAVVPIPLLPTLTRFPSSSYTRVLSGLSGEDRLPRDWFLDVLRGPDEEEACSWLG